MAKEHDADLNDCSEDQDDGKTNVEVGESRAAPIESVVELVTFFAHASSQSDTANVLESPRPAQGTFRLTATGPPRSQPSI